VNVGDKDCAVTLRRFGFLIHDRPDVRVSHGVYDFHENLMTLF
jgi:hypothetical protein